MNPTTLVLDESYWIVKVIGKEQGWSDIDIRKLEKPKDFIGYISSTDWTYQASPNRRSAYKFKTKPIIDPKSIGPWWYKITKCQYIQIKRTVTEEEILHL